MHLFIKEKEIEKIVLEHLLRIRKIEEKACGLIREQIQQLTVRVLLVINQNLKNKDTSKKYECLYYLMLDSREKYQAYIALVDEHAQSVEDKKVRDILNGIREIAVNAIEEMDEQEDNPIAYERMVMISSGILRMKQLINDETERMYSQCDIGNHVNRVELIDFLNHHVTTFFENNIPKVHKIIDETTQSLGIREAAGPYVEYMMDQKNKLETLVLVQVDIIEDRLGEGADSDLFRSMIGILQEIYQQTLLVESKVKAAQLEQITPGDIIDMNMTNELIENHLLSRTPLVEELLKEVEDNRQDSLNELLNKVTDELDKLTGQTVNDIKALSAPVQLLSCSILEMFGQAVDKLEMMNVTFQSEEGGKISKGIIETMILKHDVLKEKDTEYQVRKKDVSITEEKKLFDIKSEFENDAQSILNEAIDGSNDRFLNIQEKFKKRVDAIKTNHTKHDMAYLRDDLLYELRTFDEIVKLSVERLIECEESTAEPIVEIMKKVYDDSRKALNKSGILFLEPHPHEKFDGKLHEVLIAERAEGYKKGEVITCQNIGYIKDGFVIMRANVMAAK